MPMRWFRIHKEHLPILWVSVGINMLIIIAFIGIGVYVFQAHGLSFVDELILKHLPEREAVPTYVPQASSTAATSSPLGQ